MKRSPKTEPMARRIKDHYGFSQTVLAKLVDVPMWRLRELTNGERPTKPEQDAIACVQAFCALVSEPFCSPAWTETVERQPVDAAAFFECRIVEYCPLTPTDLWVGNRRDLVAMLAGLDDEENRLATLDLFDPNWRETYKSYFEVCEGEDGENYIRPVEPGFSWIPRPEEVA